MTSFGRARRLGLVLGIGMLGASLLSPYELLSGRTAVRRASAEPAERAAPVPQPTSPVLLELFTSEGCSSCPPADRLLTRLASAGQIDGVPVIALEWHVDYWNYIGWADPFSSKSYTKRQEDYARALLSGRSYTPQLVIDGASETIGTNQTQLRALVGNANQREKARLTLSQRASILSITVDGALTLAEGAELWLAVTERAIQTAVLRGENAGQTLPHGPVVRTLRKLGRVDRTPFSLSSELPIERGWKREELRAVAFLQRANRQIIGAAELPIAP